MSAPSSPAPFSERVLRLPHLGLGVSTEYGAAGAQGALNVAALRRQHPDFAQFLELGIEASKGLDADAEAWVARGLPCTYHFLDINLDEPEDFDPRWLDAMNALIHRTRPAWLCGDAGLWHFGPRDRGHMLLLPPVLSGDSAKALAAGIVRLRAATGLEVLPENPPGHLFLGDLHLLDYFGRVCEAADTGLLLDAAHLAIYQRAQGHAPTTGLDGLDLSRVVEIHVAGASARSVDGLTVFEDDHTPAVLADTWAILDAVAPHAPNLRAVVFECERNPVEAVVPVFAQLARRLAPTPFGRRSAALPTGGGHP